MSRRAILCCAVLIIGLLVSLNAGAESCDRAGCPAARPTKPLDIMKFMREQAASTRAADAKVAQKPVPPKRRTIAAQPKPLPTEAATSFAAQAAPEVEVVESDELTAIDRAGEAAPPETVGTGPAAEPAVPVVDAGAVGNTAPKAEDRPPSPADASRDPVQTESVSHSWLEWLWSALKGTFAALTAAVHQLI